MQKKQWKTVSDTPQNVCSDLWVTFTHVDGDWYCQKYNKALPNKAVALMYCTQYHRIGCCFIDQCKEKGIGDY